MRCGCLQCQLEAALKLLRSGRIRMGTLLVEQALETERARVEATKPKAPPRLRKARARA
jgi:hypothetical protein